jgi:GATA-binding protein
MENITWRMMALALKKKKEEEDSIAAALATKPSSSFSDSARENQSSSKSCSSSPPTATKDQISHLLHQQHLHQQAPSERGRRIDKGKAKVRVVGFDGMNQDEGDVDQQESVSALRSHHKFTYMPHIVLRQWTGVL